MNLPDLHLIFAASGAGVAALIVIVVVSVVWYRIRADRKKAAYYNPKSFRDRRSHLEAETPIARGYHRRLSSTSSFGDGATPEEVFAMSVRESRGSRESLPPQLRNPPPPLGPTLVPPVPPIPVVLRAPVAVAVPVQGVCVPYAPRVYTPAGSAGECVEL